MRLRHYAALLLLACSAAPAAARIVHSETSLYQNILVAQVDTIRCMQFTVRKDQRNQSCVDTRSPRRLVFAYTQMMMAALLVNPAPTRILMIGLGGGSLPTAFAELFPDAVIDVVELDPAVFEVAKKYFAFKPSSHMRVFVQDARVWGKRAAAKPERYDLILLDAYNGDYIPEHLMTREYLRETAALLTDDGVLAANTFAISQLYHNESVTYADVFGTFLNLRAPDSSNRIIIARRPPLPDKTALEVEAQRLRAVLKPYGVPIDRYPAQMTTDTDWDTHARVLTDQYSPANLLKGQPQDQRTGQ
jgi:spermidine synthase